MSGDIVKNIRFACESKYGEIMKSETHKGGMRRMTVTLDREFWRQLEDFMQVGGHQSVSEAIRDLGRYEFLKTNVAVAKNELCMAMLSYSYNYKTKQLGQKFNELYNASHLFVSLMKSQLQDEVYIEIVMLKGLKRDVDTLAKEVIGQSGVRYPQLQIFPLKDDC